jgi:hypothetical protein
MSEVTNDLKQEERERLKKEIIEELERDAIKKDVLSALGKEAWKPSFSKFIQHPVFILIVTFVLTGYLGSKLAAEWQSREWDRQQLRLVQLHNSDLKYGLIDEINKAVGTQYAAIRSVHRSILYSDIEAPFSSKNMNEAIKNWRLKREEWNVDFAILNQKLLAHVNNPDAQKLLATLDVDIIKINADLNEILDDIKRANWQETDAIHDSWSGNIDLLKNIGAMWGKLTAVIRTEADADIQGQR